MTSFVSWNCRGIRSRIDDVKNIISTYNPICLALQETFLKPTNQLKIRGFHCFRKDCSRNSNVSGGVCIFTSNRYPSTEHQLNTTLQAVAVRIHTTRLITICSLYLPPHDVINLEELNALVDQLPAPFCIVR